MQDHLEVETLIVPDRKIEGLGLEELWSYRELIFGMVIKDIATIKNQTPTAWFWRFLQPTFTIITYTILFEHIGDVDFKTGVPFYFMMAAAMLPWQLFTTVVTGAVGSIVSNASFFSKVYFPRAVLPLVSVTNAVVDFVIASSLLLCLLFYMGMPLTWNLVFFPLYGLWALILGLGIGLLLAALNALYREIYQSLGYILQVGFFFSPVVYPASSIPEKYQEIYSLNPLVGIIDGFRWSFLQQGSPPNESDIWGLIFSIALLCFSFWFFRKVERVFADII
jgi:lipopolysaccharide transport system permease protein